MHGANPKRSRTIRTLRAGAVLELSHPIVDISNTAAHAEQVDNSEEERHQRTVARACARAVFTMRHRHADERAPSRAVALFATARPPRTGSANTRIVVLRTS